jgi:hypothetical protein
MAIVCSKFLLSYPLSEGVSTDTVKKRALTGYYGFLDYAAAAWAYHAKYVNKMEDDATEYFSSNAVLQTTLFLKNSLDAPMGDLDPDGEIEPSLNDQHTVQTVEGKTLHRVQLVRSIIEALSGHGAGTSSEFLSLNGPITFKRPKMTARCSPMAFQLRKTEMTTQNITSDPTNALPWDAPFKSLGLRPSETSTCT